MLEYAYYHRSSEALKIPNRRNVREAIMTMHTDMVNRFKAMFEVSLFLDIVLVIFTVLVGKYL
jgi:hypothetical protein